MTTLWIIATPITCVVFGAVGMLLLLRAVMGTAWYEHLRERVDAEDEDE